MKLKKVNDEMVESYIRETELVEEFLDVLDYEETNSLIRMEMNVIEFPIFSKNPRVKKDQILKYYFSKDKKSYLEITPPANEAIPGEFDERVFIALLKVMKKKGGKSFFYCSLSEIADGLNIPNNSKRGIYSKIKNSIIKLSKTNYSFFNIFYLGSLNKKVDDLINTPLITSRIITFKDAGNDEKDLFSDKRIKEIYKIRIADEIYGNITNKGYLVFDADVLLNIKDPVVRSLHTQITKWRNNSLYLKKPLTYIAKKIPLSLKGNMLYKTVKKINDSLTELKNLKLISDFNYINNGKTDKNEFEILFDSEHNKYKQQLFYQDKEDHNNIIHSVEERLNDNGIINDFDISEIIKIFGPKGAALKTLPNVIKEALNSYEYEYVKYTAEYTAYNAKASLLKYFKDALVNNWADEYIAKRKVKEAKEEKNSSIENAIIIEENQEQEKKFSWIDFEELSMEDQNKLEKIAYNKYLAETDSSDNKITKGIFEKTKKGLITKLYDEFIQIKNQNHDDQRIVDINFVEKEPEKQLSDGNNRKFDYMELELKSYPSIAKFTSELYLLVKKRTKEIELMDIASSLKVFKEYEDDYYYARFDEKTNLGGYREKL